MVTAEPEMDRPKNSRPSHRILLKGLGVYGLAVPLVAAGGYIIGWREPESYGIGFLYAAVILVLFGFCMAAGNSIPVQFNRARFSLRDQEPEPGKPSVGAKAAGEGFQLFLSTLIGGALLGLTGLFLIL